MALLKRRVALAAKKHSSAFRILFDPRSGKVITDDAEEGYTHSALLGEEGGSIPTKSKRVVASYFFHGDRPEGTYAFSRRKTKHFGNSWASTDAFGKERMLAEDLANHLATSYRRRLGGKKR